MNCHSIFSSIQARKKSEGGPFAYLQQEAGSFLRLASPPGVELVEDFLVGFEDAFIARLRDPSLCIIVVSRSI
jgi:hypothetical protein